jgi:drug/metabolite transporter (DMT)-like permease
MTAINESLTPAAPRTNVAARLAGLVTVMLWGSAFVAIRAAGETISPGALALGRALVSSAILSGVAFMRREPLPSRRDLTRSPFTASSSPCTVSL